MKFLLLAILSITSLYANDGLVKRKTLNESDKKLIVELLKKNDVLFNAFLSRDGIAIEKSAADLSTLMSQIDSKILGNVKKESSKLSKIKDTNTDEVNLTSYEAFLNPLVEVVKAFDLGDQFNIFTCPMVKKSWIQDVATNKEVKNVYAMEMLECGSQVTQF